MARPKRVIPTDLSVAEIKKLLAVKARMEPLERKKEKLEKELVKIESDLASLMRGAAPKPRRRKKAKKKVTKKKKKVAKKRVRRVARKATKKVAKKKARKKTTKKVRKGKAAPTKKGKKTLEDVVAGLIRSKGKSMAFQDILSTITKKKLVATKSKNFANVLRRTLSTSKKIKRVGRGVYGVKR